MKLVMVIRDSHLQLDKTKISIEADLHKFICNPDKPDYVDLLIIWNINGQRKQMQQLLHVRVS